MMLLLTTCDVQMAMQDDHVQKEKDRHAKCHPKAHSFDQQIYLNVHH